MVGDAYGALKHIGEVGLHFVLRREEPPTSPHDSRHDSRGVSLLGLGGGAHAAAPSEAVRVRSPAPLPAGVSTCNASSAAASVLAIPASPPHARAVSPPPPPGQVRRIGTGDQIRASPFGGTLASAASEISASPPARPADGSGAGSRPPSCSFALPPPPPAPPPPPRVALTRGHARQLLAEVWLPAERFDALPSVLQHGTHIKCVVALITQGINAQQTVANAVAPALVDLQELINAEAALLLRRYHDAHASLRRASAERPEGYRAELGELEGLMAQVEAAALRSQSLLHNERNTAIITLTEQLVRALHGGRVTSCKSAKDRTSMAVTAEQVRWLVERHGLDADEAPALVDEMRSRGCRWQNMRKNVSKGTYAFNWIQQRLLPEIYRAPKGTYRQWGGTPT